MTHDWERFYDLDVPRHLAYPNKSLPDLLAQAGREHPHAGATLFHGSRLSYGQLADEAVRFGSGLSGLGLKEHERIALMLPNLPQFPIAFFGALQAGLIVVPTNPLYTIRELEYQLSDSGASAIISLPAFLPRVLEAQRRTDVRIVIVADVADALPWYLKNLYRLRRRSGHPESTGGAAIVPWRNVRTQPCRSFASSDPNEVAVLQYTGGTTGDSKGAALTHRNLVANALQVFIWQGRVHGGLSTLCVAPFFHVYGLSVGMNMSVYGHGLMVLAPRFDARSVRDLIRKHRPTLFPGVPTMYIALNSLEGGRPDDFSSLEICISGAAAMPEKVQAKFSAMSKARLVEGYGLTEAGPVTHCNPIHGSRIGSVGVPFPDTDARVVGPDSWEDVEAGSVGELIVKGPQVMRGYWNRPHETDRVLKDGWLRTGDLARIDSDGFFYVVDRIKDVIIAGGYNIYPREVEEVLFHHPAVLEAAVVGVESEYRGETVKAFVVLRAGMHADQGSILAHCREHLAVYKVPTVVEFVEALPKSLIGKVLRRKLREPDETDEANPTSKALPNAR